MARIRLAGSVATAALIVAVMAGCANGDPTPAPSPSPTTQTTSPAPTTNPPTTPPTTATPPTDTEIAADTVSALVRTYFETVDLVRQDPERPPTDLDAVASSTELAAQKNLLDHQRGRGLRQLGDVNLIEVQVESVNLEDPATVVVDVCWDVSGVDVVDESNQSVVTSERKNVGWTRLTATNPTWESEPIDGWRVSGGSDLETEPCVGS